MQAQCRRGTPPTNMPALRRVNQHVHFCRHALCGAISSFSRIPSSSQRGLAEQRCLLEYAQHILPSPPAKSVTKY
jgi:hypothetical protein